MQIELFLFMSKRGSFFEIRNFYETKPNQHSNRTQEHLIASKIVFASCKSFQSSRSSGSSSTHCLLISLHTECLRLFMIAFWNDSFSRFWKLANWYFLCIFSRQLVALFYALFDFEEDTNETKRMNVKWHFLRIFHRPFYNEAIASVIAEEAHKKSINFKMIVE